MKNGVKAFKKEYRNVDIDKIEVFIKYILFLLIYWNNNTKLGN